jgi:hypothetical protein
MKVFLLIVYRLCTDGSVANCYNKNGRPVGNSRSFV